MDRRNRFSPAGAVDARHMELFSIPDLKARAVGGFREDAPDDAARARERLVEIFRIRSLRGPYLDLYRPDRESGAWSEGDVEGLEWLCTLAEAGHVGAARLADRVIAAYASLMATKPYAGTSPFSGSIGVRLMALANRFPRVAAGLAMLEAIRDDTDLAALADWLELAGNRHAELGREIRALLAGPALEAEEIDLVKRYGRMSFGMDDGKAMELAEVPMPVNLAERRLARHRVKPTTPEAVEAAIAVLEHAASSGSTSAKEALWFARHDDASDKAGFVQEWLRTHVDPWAEPRKVCLAVAMALDEGKAGQPPDAVAALPWYAKAVGRKLASIDAEACGLIGAVTASARNLPLALRWLERGMKEQHPACIGLWMEIRTREKTGVGLDVDVVLERAHALFATGGPRGPLYYSLEQARMRADIYAGERLAAKPPDMVAARKWLEIAALLGDVSAASRLLEMQTKTPVAEHPEY